ncbi:MAG: ferrous iron transport protein A [Treponema sp.]|jgi:ferrous iron transport protein A|nr:ferrous iron transport protein A [Treponema sp.]
MRTLKEVKPGERVRVVKLHGSGPVKKRLMDMGIIRNTELAVRRAAPLGDPIEVSVRGYELSLRKADIDIIEITGITGAAGVE